MEKSRMSKITKIIFFTVFLELLGYGILIPVIPLLVTDPTSPFFLLPPTATLESGLILLGFLIAVYPIGQFFSTPILGQLSDRYGRKPILIISILGTSISYVLFAIGIITKNIPLLFFSRFFDGMTGGNIAVAQATIADITTPENRARNFGMIGAAFGLGFIFGPYIGGKLSSPAIVSWFNPATPFYFAAILAVCNVLSIWTFLPETHVIRTIKKISFSKSIENIRRGFALPGLKNLFGVSFLFNAGFTFFTTFFSVFLIVKFGFNEAKIGNFFGYVGVWSVFTQAVVTRFMAKRFKPEAILSVSLFACAFMLLMYFLPRESWQLYLIPPFFSLAAGLSMVNLGTLISNRTDRTTQGEIMGISASITALAQSIPPILSGLIASLLTPTTPILIASGIVFIGWIFFMYTKNKKVALATLPEIS